MDFLFITTLFFYLLSVIGSLIVFLFNRHFPIAATKAIIAVHFISGLSLLSYLLFELDTPAWISIFFWCSGIFLAGDAVRKSFHSLLKGYFLAFLLTLPVFIVSPSRIIQLVAGKGFGNPSEGRTRVIDNYFLVKTSEPVDSIGYYRAKFIKEMGFFHKTLARGIPVPNDIDSTSIIGSINDDMQIRLVLHYGPKIDTVDLELFKVQPKPNTITRKP